MNKSTISIQLKNNLKVYFPGQTICGHVTLDLDEAKDVKSVTLQFLGMIKIGFELGNHSRKFQASEEIMNFIVDLQDPGTKTLPAGTTVLPFTFKLPLDIPSSFSSPSGRVIYSMTSRITRAWYKFNLETTCLFHVIGIVDLNSMKDLSESVYISDRIPIGIMCCKKGSIEFKVSYPRKGYVPGETLSVTAEMINNSTKDVVRSKFSLVMETSYFVERRKLTHQQHICCSLGPGVKPGEKEMWMGRDIMTIPPIPPTNLGGCSLIHLQYFLRFEMIVAGDAGDFKCETPVEIGSIPLRIMFPDKSALAKEKSCEGVKEGDEIVRKPRTRVLDPIPSPSIVSLAPVFAAYPDLPPFIFAKSSVRVSTKLGTLFQTTWQIVKKGDGDIQPYEEDDSDEEQFNPNYIYYTR